MSVHSFQLVIHYYLVGKLYTNRKAGNNLIPILSDIALAILLMLPLIIVRVLLSNNKNIVHSSKLAQFCSAIIILNFLLIKISIDMGEFLLTLFWQFLIIYQISVGVIYYLLHHNREDSSKSLLAAFKRKQQYTLGLIIILCLTILVIGIKDSNQKVLDTHNQLILDLLESDHAMETLVIHTITPSTMLEILPVLHEIKEGEIVVLSLPWKSTVKVTTDTNNGGFNTREFTYVRWYREWKLDGMYRTSGYDRSNN